MNVYHYRLSLEKFQHLVAPFLWQVFDFVSVLGV